MLRPDAIELLHGLVAIPSLSREEHEAAAWLVTRMHAAGYDRAFVDEAGNAVGEIGPETASRTIVLLGHIDTVPGNIRVRIEPRGDGDVLYGRGSVDAKGPLATLVCATARAGAAWAHAANVRVVVVGAVEEEAASSKGARFVARRFDGVHGPVPIACIIGEPSGWRRVTLGYKGRLLLEIEARQPMAHTAGPDASVATCVVDIWNRVRADADAWNVGRDKAFDQLSPSLRTFNTSTDDAMDECARAVIAWRLPVEADPVGLANTLTAWLAAQLGAAFEATVARPAFGGPPIELDGRLTRVSLRFHAFEAPWRGDRRNPLVRAFLAAVRAIDPAVQPGFVLKTGTSDMNVVGPVWNCPIVAYGPGDSTLDHTPHEHVELDDYWRAVLVLEAWLRALVDG